MPALLTRMSMCPAWRNISFTAWPTAAASATSASTANDPLGRDAATRCAPARFRSTTAMVAPAQARRKAIASPMPVAAPVTMATLPVSENMSGWELLLLLSVMLAHLSLRVRVILRVSPPPCSTAISPSLRFTTEANFSPHSTRTMASSAANSSKPMVSS